MSLPAGPLKGLEVRQAPPLAAHDYVAERGGRDPGWRGTWSVALLPDPGSATKQQPCFPDSQRPVSHPRQDSCLGLQLETLSPQALLKAQLLEPRAWPASLQAL